MGILSYIRSFFITPEEPKKQYVLLSKTGVNHFAHIPGFSELEAKLHSYAFDDEHDFHSVALTDKQAAILHKIVDEFGDFFDEDHIITLPPNRYFTKDMPALQADEESATVSKTATPGILLDIPVYPGNIRGIDVAILDTLMVKDTPILQPYKVSVVKSYVGNQPCEAHGTNVAEIIAQGFNPKQTDMQFKNFAVFDCNGSSATSTIASAVKDIIHYKNGPGKHRKLVVNFSGGGPVSPILDTLFGKLANVQGVSVVVAAGNSGLNCSKGSPATIASHTAVQTVGALGKKGDPQGCYKPGQDIAPYSNYSTEEDKCVDEYYQGCYTLPDPFSGRSSVGCGTSFAAPVGTIRRVVYEGLHKKSNPMQAKKDMQADTIPAIGPDGVTVNAITPPMAFSWKKQQNSKAASLVDLAKPVEEEKSKEVAELEVAGVEVATVTENVGLKLRARH